MSRSRIAWNALGAGVSCVAKLMEVQRQSPVNALKRFLLSSQTSSSSSASRPLLAFAMVLPAAPFVLSGIIRATTALSLAVALAIALALCGAILLALRTWLRSRLAFLGRPSSWSWELASLAMVGVAVWALYIRDFAGFPNLDGWDGGTHVVTKQQFATTSPAAYNSQIAFYALALWLERLFGLDSLASFTGTFYVGVIGTLALANMVMFASVETVARTRAASMGGVATQLVAALAVYWFVWLPLLHYNQAAGYYAHMFGLLPLMLIWAADVFLRSQAIRIGALLLFLAVLRYTYALNLADAFVAVAAIVLFERASPTWKIVHGALALGLAVAAWAVFSQLKPVFTIWGGIQRFDVDVILRADLILSVGVLLYSWLSSRERRREQRESCSLLRFVRFPVFFALAGTGFLHFLRQQPTVKQYYVTKYPVWAAMLLSLVAVVIVGHLIATIMQRSAFRRWDVWLRMALVAGLILVVPQVWQKTFLGYRETFQERLLANGPPYRYLRPVADPATAARIKAVLTSEKKAFGGYLTAFFPMFSFMNATLGYHTGYQDFFPPLAAPGRCVFWVPQARDIYRLGPAQKIDAYRLQIASAGAHCSEDYPVPWTTTPQSLCHHCF